MAHEFGPRLLALIQQRRWSQLVQERAGCTYMARHCIICGQYVGRALAMHHHYRSTHQAPGNLVQTKATQLTNLLSDESPCSACGMSFLRTHACNVWYQVAMLLLHWPKPHQVSLQAEPEALSCKICGTRCATAAYLHKHLQTEHKLVSSVWSESRDRSGDSFTCRHCNTTFQSLAGLRSHVNQGRCKNFDPDLPTETLPIAPIWIDACCRGRLEEVLKDPTNRLKLTLRCQCCPRRYTRAADLSAHLQSAHPALWSQAHDFVFMLQALAPGPLGCVCNPSCSIPRGSHVCLPFWQLAMQMCRMQDAILMPNQLNLVELARTMPPHIPVDLRDIFEQALRRYDLTTVWTDALLLNSLSDSCYFCGLNLQPAELCYHLHEAHAGQHATVKSYVSQLMPHALAHMESDCVCFACGQIFNQPLASPNAAQQAARKQLVRAHLRTQCPSLAQIALVLTHIHHGIPRLADGAGRRSSAAGGDGLQESGSSVRRQFEAGSQPGSTQTPTQKRAKRGHRKQPAERPVDGNAADADAPGQIGHTVGPGHAAAPPRDHIPVLLQLQRAGWGSPHAPEGGGGLAQTSSVGVVILDDDATETEAVPNVAERNNPQSSSPVAGGGDVPDDPDGHQNRHSSARPDLPLHAVGCKSSAAEGHQQDPGKSPEDVRQSPRAPGHVCGQLIGAEIPQPALEVPVPGNTMEAAALHTHGWAFHDAVTSGLLPGLDGGGDKLEAPQPTPKSSVHHFGNKLGTSPAEGHTGSTERDGQGERKGQDQAPDSPAKTGGAGELTKPEIVTILANMVLENPNNLCYANAALYALVWTLVTLNQYHTSLWGTQCQDIMIFLASTRDRPGNLVRASFYQHLLRCMGDTEINLRSGSISQQDSAEYVQLWLQMLQTTAFDMQWEKRYDADGHVYVMDSQHTCHTPLCLKFDAITVQCSLCDVTSLARSWHQVDGMKTGLLRASPCLCIHLDRCTIGPQLEIFKCDSKLQADSECFLPVFNDGSITCTFVGYQIVAMMAHLGGDGCGHYRSALRLRPMVLGLTTPVSWIVTDDWTRPQTTWIPPNWLLENATLLWLVRTDQMDLPNYPVMPEPQSASVAGLLRMFAYGPTDSSAIGSADYT